MILSKKFKSNDTIGDWVLLKQVEKPLKNKTNGIYWLCKCKCGKEKVIFEQTLSQGKSKSCGCSRHKDLTGQRFGNLMVIKRNNRIRRGYTESAWLCKCSCGNECVVSECHLIDKKSPTQSCGCLRIKKVKQVCKKYNIYDLSKEYGIGYTANGKEFYFDLEDYDKIKDYCWHLNVGGYVVSGNLRLNRLILNCSENYVVDHIDRNPLNNQKNNLRLCMQRNNTKNTSMRSSNRSGFTGVWKDKRNGRWTAEITVDNKKLYLGNYRTLLKAAIKRFEANVMYFGEFSPYYRPQSNMFETIFFNKEDNKTYRFTYKDIVVPISETDVEEITYDELKAIPSNRGDKCLGSTGK